jgi:hypothetical protein|tara:strand:- start:3155 stop:3550 length:396 start_codon:yes stop_codon:yes gene_type:complete
MFAKTVLILAAIATSGDRLAPRRCDRAELNATYSQDSEGNWKPNFRQWIFWDFDAKKQCWVVRGWVIVKGDVDPPERFNGRRRLILCSDRHGRSVIEPQFFSRTHTGYDPELENREILPADRRRPIFSRGQ